ncbi:MAG TPA: superoxide dismutase family protein [Kofleriaceae bacterium]|nr:superoxide dismutase family protein [Kofleriaceae bacterium]
MKRTGMLFALVLAACGSAQKSTTTPIASDSETASAEAMANPSPPPGSEDDKLAPPVEEETPPVTETPAIPAQAEPPKPAAPQQALAMLTAVKDGKDVGTVSFELGSDNVIVIQGDFHDLPAGKHAIYIYENGDCSGKGKKIGKHLDPTKQKHGPPSSATRHAGDFGNVEIAKEGTGTFQMSTDSLSFELGRADTVTSRAIVVHAKADNAKGNAGAPIACGVISTRSE